MYNMLYEECFKLIINFGIGIECSDTKWCSPHNPTGKVFSKDELEIIAGACRTLDILAVTDEV